MEEEWRVNWFKRVKKQNKAFFIEGNHLLWCKTYLGCRSYDPWFILLF